MLYSSVEAADTARRTESEARRNLIAARAADNRQRQTERASLTGTVLPNGQGPAELAAEADLDAAITARQAADTAALDAWRHVLDALVDHNPHQPANIDQLTAGTGTLEEARADYLAAIDQLERARARFGQTLATWSWFAAYAATPAARIRTAPDPRGLVLLGKARYPHHARAALDATRAITSLEAEARYAGDAARLAIANDARRHTPDLAARLEAELDGDTQQVLEANRQRDTETEEYLRRLGRTLFLPTA
ncbi:MAG: hypothetical protein KDB51_14905 [Propionibacteriaceae bacterium]|nr:hypothetical protein [Propionibacteriaceae bacterium]